MKLLIVDGDAKRARFLVRALAGEGLVSDVCRGVDVAARPLGAIVYDGVILDATGTAARAAQLCAELRASTGAPLLALTDDREAAARVLDAGADDLLGRPFDMAEMVARLFALLRRAHGARDLRVGDLEIDRRAHEVRLDGAPVAVTGREYALLLHLLLRRDEVVSRDELFARVWNSDADGAPGVVDVQMSRLRRKLGARGWMLETVRGEGYRLRAKHTAVALANKGVDPE